MKLIWVDVNTLVWPCHDIDPAHIHPTPATKLTVGPIRVEQLATGHYFVHDGRHRVIRAKLAGRHYLQAELIGHRP